MKRRLTSATSRYSAVFLLVFVIVFAGLGSKLFFFSHAAAPTVGSCTLHATTTNFSSVFSSAAGGSVICLAPGNYGNWAGGTKNSMVTITPDTAAGATAPTPPTPSSGGLNANGTGTNGNVIFSGLNFRNDSFITLDGITFTGDVDLPWGTTTATVHDITIQNSIFHAHLEMNDSNMTNANIIINYNMFPGDSADCINGPEGRIQVGNSSHAATPDGIIIENNNIGGVPSVQCDGVQEGAYGLQVLNNWFHDYHYQNAAHTDGIQLYGSSHSVIKGNFFYNVPDGIVGYDGTDTEDIENNIMVNDCTGTCNGASPNQFAILGNSGATIAKHNTVVGGMSWANSPEGVITIGVKSGTGSCTGLTINDNVATTIGNGSGGGNCTYTASFNDLQQGGGNGSGNIAGAPIYNGGDCGNLNADPPGACGDVWANFLLKSTSPGHNAADDGTDMGAFGAGPATPGGPYGSGGGSGPVTGDFNSDGHVNIFDLSIFLNHWQQSGTGLAEDLNNDSVVNIFDLSILLSHYGT